MIDDHRIVTPTVQHIFPYLFTFFLGGGEGCTSKYTCWINLIITVKILVSVALACLWNNYYNIVFTRVLPNSYWAIIVEVLMCRVRFGCRTFVQFSCEFLSLHFSNVNITLNNPNPTSRLWLLPIWDVYWNLSIFTLFVYIFIAMSVFDFVCLYNIFLSLQFVWRSEFFIDNFRNQTRLSRCLVVRTLLSISKHVLQPKLFSLY